MRGLIFAIIFSVMFNFNPLAFAQILDDDFDSGVVIENEDSAVETKEEHEELFDEMFGNESEVVIKKASSGKLDKAADEIVKDINIKKSVTRKRNDENVVVEPLEGELFIGVSKNSFKLSQDMMGRTVCTFGVTLKSTLNRDIKTLALRLAYQQSAFAFIFRNVKANGSDEKYISTNGDICYNLSGVPDIDINRCRIFNARDDECARRIKWEEGILSPDPTKNPYL